MSHDPLLCLILRQNLWDCKTCPIFWGTAKSLCLILFFGARFRSAPEIRQISPKDFAVPQRLGILFCSVLQCVAVCCSVLQCPKDWASCFAVCCSVSLQCCNISGANLWGCQNAPNFWGGKVSGAIFGAGKMRLFWGLQKDFFACAVYGVASISRLLEIIGLFCRLQSLS